MEIKDRRYLTVKRLIEAGHITVFKEIFDTIPPSRVAKDLGFNYLRLVKLTDQVDGWILKDVYELAKLIDVEGKVITDLIHNQYAQAGKKRKK
ncbi:hypothetical protein D3H65_22930 [Paraflavitalea soli]|uniref:XRE family transcriptional regulator n=1 Tax=Paraflavitalea soli TaxID=2315862 RepID=A0A3B7MQA5_9BACT|nr:hypothetical protein [Paraflavitalea soli]AXY76672.1 hypothetical protein D3H65_22930 [Paraflavitalea soli]